MNIELMHKCVDFLNRFEDTQQEKFDMRMYGEKYYSSDMTLCHTTACAAGNLLLGGIFPNYSPVWQKSKNPHIFNLMATNNKLEIISVFEAAKVSLELSCKQAQSIFSPVSVDVIYGHLTYEEITSKLVSHKIKDVILEELMQEAFLNE